MFLVGRIGHEHQAGHPRLEYDSIAAIEFDDHALAYSPQRCDRASDGAAAKWAQTGGDLDRSQPAARPVDGRNAAADDRRQATFHSFDFGEFRHEIHDRASFRVSSFS